MSKTERDLDDAVDALDEQYSHEFDGAGHDEAADHAVDEADDDSMVDDVAVAEHPDDVDHDTDTDASVDQAIATDTDTAPDLDDADDAESYELPDIVMASEADDPDGGPARGDDPLIVRQRTDGDDEPDQVDDEPDVSDDVLEELRRADIDGPMVGPAPQDDTSSAIRRPRRSPDYDPSPFPIPMAAPRMLGRKPRVRRVTRVVRHVDPWTVFKIALVANLVLYLIVLVAGVLLWNVAYATGTVDNVERFFESFGWSTFEFDGGQIYHSGWIAGIFLVIGFTGLAVLMATLFNLITDLVGGVRFTVLEEEVVEARQSPMRRFVVRRAEPEIPVSTFDESGPIVREAIVDDTGGFDR